MPDRLTELLNEIHDLSIRIAPDDFVFGYDDGRMLGATWWLKRFDKAMTKAGIDKKSRNLVPHSLTCTDNSRQIFFKRTSFGSNIIQQKWTVPYCR